MIKALRNFGQGALWIGTEAPEISDEAGLTLDQKEDRLFLTFERISGNSHFASNDL